MEIIHILNKVYALSDLTPPDCQDAVDNTSDLLDHFNLFCVQNKIREETKKVIEMLYNKCIEIDQKDMKLSILNWLADYGCVMISKCHYGVYHEKMEHVSLIALDNWEFKMCGEANRAFYSQSDSYVELDCAVIHPSLLEVFQSRFSQALLEIQVERTGDKRSGGDRSNNHGGHQKTPAFIDALVYLIADNGALEKEWEFDAKNTSIYPKGAFTDVGLHTGGKKRNTTWSLMMGVSRLVSHMFGNDSRTADIHFHEMLIEFDLWNASTLIYEINLSNQMKWRIEILQTAVKKIYEGMDSFGQLEKAKEYEQRCNEIRKRIDEELLLQAQSDANHWSFASDLKKKLNQIDIPVEHISISTPSNTINYDTLLKDLGNDSIFPSLKSSCNEIINWLESIKSEDEYTLIHKINYLHIWFCNHSEILKEGAQLEEMDHALFIHILYIEYSKLIDLYRSKEMIKNLNIDVELRSNYVLVTWICYCVVHKACYRKYPNIRKYGTSLNPRNLRHLVLAQKSEWNAVHRVVNYLTDHGDRSPLFSLKNHLSTFKFAEEFCEDNHKMKRILTIEREKERERINDQWKEVQERKRKVVDLKKEIAKLAQNIEELEDEKQSKLYVKRQKEREVERTNDELRRFSIYSTKYNYYAYELSKYEDELKSAEGEYNTVVCNLEIKQVEMNRKEEELKITEAMPLPIYQPFPRDDKLAYRVIFWMYMPDDLDILAKLSFKSCEILMPTSILSYYPNEDKQESKNLLKKFIVDMKCATNLQKYLQYQKSNNNSPQIKEQLRKCCSVYMANGSNKDPPEAKELSPKHIDNCHSSQDARQWYPDSYFTDDVINMAWKGVSGGGNCTNPFKIDDFVEQIGLRFTKQIKNEEGMKLNWALNLVDHEFIPRNRSNYSIASQDNKSKPKSISRPEYLTFCSIRSYPYQQMRKICSALRDESLPFNKHYEEIYTLFSQSLFQIGEIAPENRNQPFLWKADLFPSDNSKSWLSNLEKELYTLIDRYKNAPNEISTLRLAGELCGFVSQWISVASKDRAIVCQAMINFTNELKLGVDNASERKCDEYRSKICLYNFVGILSYAIGDIDEKDTRYLCKMMVLANKHYLVESESLGYLMFLSKTILSRLSSILVYYINENPSILTECIKLVTANCPDTMDWNHIQSKDSPCFEAIDTQEKHFSINILTGIVLINGSPPGNLPLSIIEHPKYKRVFGSRNFGTDFDPATKIFTTGFSVNGNLYSFHLTDEEKLIVKERNKETEREFELLDPPNSENKNCWSRELPIRLKMMHSHWVCWNKDKTEPEWIAFRGITYLERDISFIASYDCEMKWSLFRVPFHLKGEDIESLLGKIGKDIVEKMFIVEDDETTKSFVQILEKFEDRQFIEVYLSTNDDDNNQIKVVLPRYQREFEIKNNKLYSVDYSGYFLSKSQQLQDCLYDFTQYLVLQNEDSNSVKVLIPDRDFEQSDGKYKLSVSSKYDDNLREYAYDIHNRLKFLKATSIASRLHLAAVFSSIHCKVIEKRIGMTGEEMAMQLIRQSWVSRPLRNDEKQCFERIVNVSRYSSPILLLCYELENSSMKLNFLYNKDGKRSVTSTCAYEMEKKEYKSRDISNQNIRNSLTPDEEMTILGSILTNRKTIKRDSVYLARGKRIEGSLINKCDVTENQLKEVENRLELLLHLTNSTKQNFAFPITNENVSRKSKLANFMIKELKESWNAYMKLDTIAVKNVDELNEVIRNLKVDVTENRKKIEDYLFETINNIPEDAEPICGNAYYQFRLKKISNLVPKVQLSDFLRIGVDRSLLLTFNPFLDDKAVHYIHDNIRLWMEFCVLEDKFERIENWIKSSNIGKLDQELKAKRLWQSKDNMEWLAFEVEGQLQIRQVQYKVAKSLIDSIEKEGKITEGMITQLNMGEGKTRVIIPMLMLHFTKKSDSVVRLHFLGQLINDAFDHLHQYISASVLNRKIFIMPFKREVEISETNLKCIFHTLNYCRLSRGCVCITPESRLSMILKWYESFNDDTKLSLPKQENISNLFGKIIQDINYIDIFDESDEILRHKLQLIYAMGEMNNLSSGSSRWIAAESAVKSFDKIIKDNKYDNRKVIVKDAIPSDNESFSRFRLTTGNDIEQDKQTIYRLITEDIIKNPPYEFLWMTALKQEKKSNLIEYVSNPLSDSGLIEKFNEERRKDVMALRGVLAYGNLVHCLQGRHRVTYGTKVNGEKRLAVPYRAADTPSERSEYSHPDIAIIYTILSYYHDGLAPDDVIAAFELLLKQGSTEKEEIYRQWYELTSNQMNDRDKKDLRSVKSIDLTNSNVKDKLIFYFKKNMKTIDYWLNYIVFPKDTKQFSKQLVSTAWHLCDNKWKRPIGFSGTDDNKRLLPLQVKQQVIENDDELKATNGKMLYLILKNEEYKTIQPERNNNNSNDDNNDNKPLWKSVIEHTVEKGNALIDAGGLMAGVSNTDLAEFAIKLEQVKKAVVYFDTDEKEWKVRDKTNRVWSLNNSPIRERDAFVYFDDSRCRGADMKLLPDAKGVITIGPKMCKDKLMQAAGRMRQLDQNQSIMLLGTKEVTRQIKELNRLKDSTPVTTKEVLQWVMSNTIDSVAPDGLIEWAKHGIHFCFTKSSPKYAALDYDTKLETLYAEPHKKKVLSEILNKIIEKFNFANDPEEMKDIDDSNDLTCSEEMEENDEIDKTKKNIVEIVKTFGSEFVQTGSAVDDECEKEIEEEEEEEEEEEIEVEAAEPATENILSNYKEVLEDNEINILKHVDARTLQAICNDFFSEADPPLGIIRWSSNVYCTSNFINTCVRNGNNIAQYLRQVDAILYFKQSNILLLLAEGEADHILKVLLFGKSTTHFSNIEFLNMSYLETIKDLDAETIVSIKLFQGHTMFGNNLKPSLENMIDSKRKQKAALQLPNYRGNSHKINMSDLEKLQYGDEE